MGRIDAFPTQPRRYRQGPGRRRQRQGCAASRPWKRCAAWQRERPRDRDGPPPRLGCWYRQEC
jgi:hypothetical protein